MKLARRCQTCAAIFLLLLGGCILSPVSLQAQRRGDPLTQPEIDQLRDTAQDADLRLKLYVTFARARLDAVTELRADPKGVDAKVGAKLKDRADRTHDKLQDFLDVYDELNDNIDTFASRGADLRKVLKNIIEADNEFQAKLRALKNSATAGSDEARTYDFLLSNSLDTVDASVQDHRQLLTEQQEAAKHKKKPPQ